MKVSQLARKLNVAPDTVRFYTRIGIITPCINTVNGYKEYNKRDQNRLRFVLSARNLGFSVKDIEEILGVSETGKSGCPIVRDLIQRRLQETEQRFLETAALRNRMLSAVSEWRLKPDKEPTGDMVCHLIEEFSEVAMEEEKNE